MDAVIQKGLDLISRPEMEGMVLHPYLCEAGYWTIGIGSRYLEDGRAVTPTTPAISQATAYALASGTLTKIYDSIKSLVKVPLNVNEAAALLSFVYNVGETNFASSTLLRLLNDGDRLGACAQFGVWTKIHKNGFLITSAGLVNRRRIERDVFSTPVTGALV